jgi:hypothetical protein
MIWRERRILLLVLAVLLLGNVVFFLTYRVQYQARLDDMNERLAQAEGQLAKSRQARTHAEAQLQAYKKVERDVTEVFDQHWSTRPRRLTKLIGEIKRLADASNAVPHTYSFGRAEAEIADTPAARSRRNSSIGAEEVAINFSVDASYDQARRMINLIELSQQFMIIDGVSLSAGDENRLTLNLRLKTLFRDEQQPGAANRL